jgi:nucleoside-diphosphate-sugar epimerase
MPGHPAALPSRVAVTGSQGKLGRAVVGHLRAIGVDVLAIDRVGGTPRGRSRRTR